MQLLSNGADSALSRLFLFQFGLEYFLKFFQFLSTGLHATNIQPIELAISLKDIGLKHLIKNLRIFGIQRASRNGIKDRVFLIELSIACKLLLGNLYPFRIIN
jgi:hypothetical protein